MTSTIGLSDGEILKVDGKGRVRTPRERQEALLAEFDRSGMSGVAFAQWAGIKYPTFAAWLSKRRRTQGPSPVEVTPLSETTAPTSTKPLHWVEAVMTPEMKSSASVSVSLVVHLPDGVRMEVHDSRGATLAAEVLRQLARP